MFNAKHFIDKFELVPEEKWAMGRLHIPESDTRCALGLCCPDVAERGKGLISERWALSQLFNKYLYISAALVNDGKEMSYQQPTPKQRMLAALRDIQQLEEKENEQQTPKNT